MPFVRSMTLYRESHGLRRGWKATAWPSVLVTVISGRWTALLVWASSWGTQVLQRARLRLQLCLFWSCDGHSFGDGTRAGRRGDYWVGGRIDQLVLSREEGSKWRRVSGGLVKALGQAQGTALVSWRSIFLVNPTQ